MLTTLRWFQLTRKDPGNQYYSWSIISGFKWSRPPYFPAIAYNIKKWLSFKAPKTKIAAMAIKKTAEGLCNYYFKPPALWYQHIRYNQKKYLLI